MPTVVFQNVRKVEIDGVSMVTLSHQDTPEVSVESGWIDVGLRVFQRRETLHIIFEGRPSGSGAVIASGSGNVAIGGDVIGTNIVAGHGNTIEHGSGHPLRGAKVQVAVRLPHDIEVEISNTGELIIEGDAPRHLMHNGTTIHFIPSS